MPAREWDRLVSPGSGALSHAFLLAWEHSELAGLRSCPVVAYAAGSSRPLAACPGYFYKLDLLGVRVPALTGAMGRIRALWPGFMCALTYELGSPTPLTNPLLVAEGELRASAVRDLIGAALEEGARAGAQFLLVQNFTALRGPACEELRRLGFAGVPMPLTAVVDLGFSSFDEYLAAMRAQYRRRARQAMKRSQGLSVEHRRDFGDLAEELARLWRLVFDRATELKREILTVDYFRAVAELDFSSVLLTRRPDGSIASFGLLLEESPWLTFLQCGFDEHAAREEGAYFRLLYEIVRFGIEGGFQQVELGVTTLEPKFDVGAIPVPLFAWVRHRNPAVQALLRTLASRLIQPDRLQPRKVFKEPPPSAEELVARRGLPLWTRR